MFCGGLGKSQRNYGRTDKALRLLGEKYAPGRPPTLECRIIKSKGMWKIQKGCLDGFTISFLSNQGEYS
jgi:hypothetical protein